MTGVDPKGLPWRDIPVDDETLSYVMKYGGRCRDCADNFGVCSTGLPCKPDEARTAIRHVLRAINYGMSHGYLPGARTPLKGAPVAYAYVIDGECEEIGWGKPPLEDPSLVPLFASQPLPETEEKP